jgi:hypothetical protein
MKNITIISVDGEVAKIEGHCGCRFATITEEAIALSASLNQRVEYEFNGVICVVTADSDADAIWQYVQDTWEQERLAREATPEYVELQCRLVEAAITRSSEMNALLDELDHVVAQNIELTTMRWLRRFLEYADWGDIQYDKQLVADKFKLMGYINDDLVGNFPQDPSNTDVFRWIIGQAINMLEVGASPHPSLIPQTERCIETAEYESSLLTRMMTASSV